MRYSMDIQCIKCLVIEILREGYGCNVVLALGPLQRGWNEVHRQQYWRFNVSFCFSFGALLCDRGVYRESRRN